MSTTDLSQIPMNIEAQQYSWAELLYAIKNKKCILVLGPYLSTAINSEGKEQPLIELLAEELAAGKEITNRHDLAFVAEELYRNNISKSRLLSIIEDFYKKHKKSNKLLDKIVRLPFHLIINTAPDNLILRAYLKVGEICGSDYYNFDEYRGNIDFKKDKINASPFVYNLMGLAGEKDSISVSDSLVLAERDRLKFISRILQKEWKIPAEIGKELNPSNMFLFLGFKFEDWYLRTMLYVLRGDTEKDNNKEQHLYCIATGDEPLNHDIKYFYHSQFNVSFIQADENTFLDQLLSEWQIYKAKAEEKQNATKGKIVCLQVNKDIAWKDKFLPYLQQSLKKCQLDVWDNSQMLGGQDIKETIMKELQTAKGIVLLVSVDFLADNFMMDNILPTILDLHNNGLAVSVLPCRACDWKQDILANLPSVFSNSGYSGFEQACRTEGEDTFLQKVSERLTLLFSFDL